jgi:2-amino-4-hydroxy-6-hydroxymethyldihydropteridine diphosphokinase
MSKAYLGLGSNLNDKMDNLIKARILINDHEKIEVTKVSSYYETSPVGYLAQANFINQVIEINTDLTPNELLTYCQDIENKLKRIRTVRFGPRTIDIDILLYDDLVIDEKNLSIPHPRMLERKFVLIPLAEINDKLIINHQPLAIFIQMLNKNNDYIRKIPKEI